MVTTPISVPSPLVPSTGPAWIALLEDGLLRLHRLGPWSNCSSSGQRGHRCHPHDTTGGAFWCGIDEDAKPYQNRSAKTGKILDKLNHPPSRPHRGTGPGSSHRTRRLQHHGLRHLGPLGRRQVPEELRVAQQTDAANGAAVAATRRKGRKREPFGGRVLEEVVVFERFWVVWQCGVQIAWGI